MPRSALLNRCALFALVLAAAGPALAQDEPSTGEHNAAGPRSSPCRADVQKLCSGVQPGGGRIVACLREHAADVSPACHDAMAAHAAKQQNGQATPPAEPAK